MPMDRLSSETQRLFGLPAGGAVEPDAAGGRRALVAAFRRAADWPAIAALYGRIGELGLAQPALSVDGVGGFQVWFSLADAVDAARGRDFLAELCRDALAALPAGVVELQPAGVALPPYALPDGERWAAFVDPALGSLFAAEPWLDFPPSADQQAELLAGCASLSAADFRQVLAERAPAPPASPPPAPAAAAAPQLAGPYADAASFLLAVINDPSVDLALRIEAARALLAHRP